MNEKITWSEALEKTDPINDITGSLFSSSAYDNFSSEESAFVDGVESTQSYFNNIIEALKQTYQKCDKSQAFEVLAQHYGLTADEVKEVLDMTTGKKD